MSRIIYLFHQNGKENKEKERQELDTRKRGLVANNDNAKAPGGTAVQKHWAHNLLKGSRRWT